MLHKKYVVTVTAGLLLIPSQAHWVYAAGDAARADERVATSAVTVEQVVIDSFRFEPDSTRLTETYRDKLELASDFLKPHREALRKGLLTLNVIGYADSKGSEEYNRQLSERRARAVADYLVEQDPARAAFIRVIGRGQADPVASNETDSGREKNRRVVLEIIAN